MTQRAVNDFTIRVATVNGSGSQSSNLVLTNAIFRLGIPVAPKNVFPSNIEGLPTWFDVRVSVKGYQCRTRDVDVLVALNAATWQPDVAGVEAGRRRDSRSDLSGGRRDAARRPHVLCRPVQRSWPKNISPTKATCASI